MFGQGESMSWCKVVMALEPQGRSLGSSSQAVICDTEARIMKKDLFRWLTGGCLWLSYDHCQG